MAHYFVFSEKDASIERGAIANSTASLKNTGLDEILEVGKEFQVDSTNFSRIARSVIYFPVNTISESIASGEISNKAKFYLNIYEANSIGLDRDITLNANAISQSWDEGDGKSTDSPQTENGVRWRYRTTGTGSQWSGNQDNWGATYYTGSSYAASQSFNKNLQVDMRMDVSPIVRSWISGSIPNEGFVVRRNSLEETSPSASGMFKFFSSDTHTVFAPKLEVEWDDSTWQTGSLSPLTSDNLTQLKFYVENMNNDYKKGSIAKVVIKGREKYPAKNFSTTSSYLDVKYLPSGSSYYSVVDTKTDTVIIPFGSGSKISCDSSGNFIKLRTGELEAERYYKLKFKVVSGSGINAYTNFYDEDLIFKVSR
jgi:hypothetical protein